MKIVLKNGVILEDVSAEEAIAILAKQGKEQVSEGNILAKLETFPQASRKKPYMANGKYSWTRAEIVYLSTHLHFKLRRLHKKLNRHSKIAVGTMASRLRTGKVKGYIKEMLDEINNEQRSGRKKTSIFRPKTRILWTKTEIQYILANPTATPAELASRLTRHTPGAVMTMTYGIRRRDFTSIGVYIKQIIEEYEKNVGQSNRVEIPVKSITDNQ